jgi:ketosteroid isomerase-like protein
MPESTIVEGLRQAYRDWNSGGTDAMLGLLDPDFEYANPEHAVEPGVRRGHDGFRTAMSRLDVAFDDYSHDLHRLVVVGDKVFVATTFRARVRDSGAEVEVPERHVWTFRDSKAVRLE